MNYAIYCRKSSDSEDRQILSLDSQENELRKLADTHKLEVLEIFRESQSAKGVGRPIFNSLLLELEIGKFDGIICWKMDRLARNFIDGGRIIDMLQKGIIKEIRTSEKIHVPDDNVVMLALDFGMANQYIRDLSSNVKRGNKTKLEQGGWPGAAPIGYINDKLNKTVLIDPQRVKYVQRAFELYATGLYTIKGISDSLYSEGFRSKRGNKVLKSRIHLMLSNRFYCGIMERLGNTYAGKHQSLISPDLFLTAQDILHGRKRPRRKKHFYPARGSLFCGACGCQLTGDTKKGHLYYYCTNGKGSCQQHTKYLRSEYVDSLLANILAEIKLDQEAIEISAEAYQAKNYKAENYSLEIQREITNELDLLLKKELGLAEMHSLGKLREEVYNLMIKEISDRRWILNDKLQETKKAQSMGVTFEQIKNLLKYASFCSNEYLEAQNDEKYKILKTTLSNLYIKDQKVYSYQFKSPFDLISKARKNGNSVVGCAIWDDIRTALITNHTLKIPIIPPLKLKEAG